MIIYKIDTNPSQVEEFKSLLKNEGLQFDMIITDNQSFHKFLVQEPISNEQKIKIEDFLGIICIEIPSENLSADCSQEFLEILIKAKGELWFYYKNDPDTHRPKNHCHNKEDNEYIDPSTGIIYDARTNLQKRVCDKKKLEIIRNKLRKNGTLI